MQASRVRSLIRRMLHCHCLEDLTMEQRRAMWPLAKPLQAKHVRHCKLVENREAMLEHMPKHGACAELGVLAGDFSHIMIKAMQPAILHLVDTAGEAIQAAERRFSREISDGIVQVHQADSASFLHSMPDRYFDFIYIDADHSYQGVKLDLEAARPKLKPQGLIALNDYIYFAPSDFAKYGVVEAVNEYCITHDFELLFFALHGRMYNDVALRKLAE